MEKSAFLEHFCELLELDNCSLTGDEELSAFESWDSLAVLGFISFADQQFSMVLSPSDINNAQTVNDLIGLFGDKVIKN